MAVAKDINIRITAENHEAVKRLAQENGQKIGWIVNVAVAEFVAAARKLGRKGKR